MAKTRIPELSMIELNSSSALMKYSQTARDLAREFAYEFDWAAQELEAALIRNGQGNPWLMGLDVKWRARRVANRARRAAELSRGAGAEMVKLWQDFVIQFAPALEQRQQKKPSFDFDN